MFNALWKQFKMPNNRKIIDANQGCQQELAAGQNRRLLS